VNTTGTDCRLCCTRADTGRIFCAHCGAPLRTPVALIPEIVQEGPKHHKRKWISAKGTLFATVLLVAYFTWQCGSGVNSAGRLSDEAVRHFHSQLDAQAYADIVEESDEALQKSRSHDEIIIFLLGVHSKLGSSRNFTRTNVFVNASSAGTLVRATYHSIFERGNAVEGFTWRRTTDGLKLMRYDVNSDVFVMQSERSSVLMGATFASGNVLSASPPLPEFFDTTFWFTPPTFPSISQSRGFSLLSVKSWVGIPHLESGGWPTQGLLCLEWGSSARAIPSFAETPSPEKAICSC
jgi:hypothetical protein